MEVGVLGAGAVTGYRLAVAGADCPEELGVDGSLRVIERILPMPFSAARRQHVLQQAADQDAHQGADNTHDNGTHPGPPDAGNHLLPASVVTLFPRL